MFGSRRLRATQFLAIAAGVAATAVLLLPSSAGATRGTWRELSVAVTCAEAVDVYAGPCDVQIKPLWDDWNSCVDDNYTRESSFTLGRLKTRIVQLGVTTRCATSESRMHWRIGWINHPEAGRADVELHVSPFNTITGQCGATHAATCRQRGRDGLEGVQVYL
jgi:hypothetical protein